MSSSSASQTARRSVVFLHHNYYHFYYLAQALRKRGWDAICVSLQDPQSEPYKLYHGEDVNLFHPDWQTSVKLIFDFFQQAKTRFQMLHLGGESHFSFFYSYWGVDAPPPTDIIEWRLAGKKVAFTISGCQSGIAQSSIAGWSALDEGRIVCNKCNWQTVPNSCSDDRNLRWGRRFSRYSDIIFAEGMPALDYLSSPKVIQEPTTMCLDADVWKPDLEIPLKYRIEKEPNEILIYHGVANYESRLREDGRNMKGTPAIVKAAERLKAEGLPVRLVFTKDVPSKDVRFIQAQADIIVEQLNLGRNGATAREGIMLGKPTISYVNRNEPNRNEPSEYLKTLPYVSATEDTVYEVLKVLALNPQKRKEIGAQSRAFALKWYSSDACAQRYEEIYDRAFQGKFSWDH